jgi:V/A-type H+-transporting ATPase subunit F
MKEEFPHNIVVVGDRATCTGYRLAGVRDVFPVEEGDAEKAIEELLGKEEVGIIIINEAVLESLGRKTKAVIERTAKPSVVAVPGMGGPLEYGESLKEMVKKALGFELMK